MDGCKVMSCELPVAEIFCTVSCRGQQHNSMHRIALRGGRSRIATSLMNEMGPRAQRVVSPGSLRRLPSSLRTATTRAALATRSIDVFMTVGSAERNMPRGWGLLENNDEDDGG